MLKLARWQLRVHLGNTLRLLNAALTPRAKALLGEITDTQLKTRERALRKRERFEMARKVQAAFENSTGPLPSPPVES
jgi:hypothetical protein